MLFARGQAACRQVNRKPPTSPGLALALFMTGLRPSPRGRTADRQRAWWPSVSAARPFRGLPKPTQGRAALADGHRARWRSACSRFGEAEKRTGGASRWPPSALAISSSASRRGPEPSHEQSESEAGGGRRFAVDLPTRGLTAREQHGRAEPKPTRMGVRQRMPSSANIILSKQDLSG